jgi:hypothetical protein
MVLLATIALRVPKTSYIVNAITACSWLCCMNSLYGGHAFSTVGYSNYDGEEEKEPEPSAPAPLKKTFDIQKLTWHQLGTVKMRRRNTDSIGKIFN